MECNYDGGDCCLDPVDTQYCSVCECIDGGSTADPGTTDNPTTQTSSSPSGRILKNTKKKLKQYMKLYFRMYLWIMGGRWILWWCC